MTILALVLLRHHNVIADRFAAQFQEHPEHSLFVEVELPGYTLGEVWEITGESDNVGAVIAHPGVLELGDDVLTTLGVRGRDVVEAIRVNRVSQDVIIVHRA